jgi:hypothetical protein
MDFRNEFVVIYGYDILEIAVEIRRIRIRIEIACKLLPTLLQDPSFFQAPHLSTALKGLIKVKNM